MADTRPLGKAMEKTECHLYEVFMPKPHGRHFVLAEDKRTAIYQARLGPLFHVPEDQCSAVQRPVRIRGFAAEEF